MGLLAVLVLYNVFGLTSFTGISEDKVKSSFGTTCFDSYFDNYQSEGLTIEILTELLRMLVAVNNIDNKYCFVRKFDVTSSSAWFAFEFGRANIFVSVFAV
jgi:hypothetical protein